jgi:hypothetical protein
VHCLLVCYPGLAAVIKEYDELKRKLEGSADRYSHPKAMSQCNIGWKQSDTAKDLGISQPAVARAIQVAAAIKEYDELKRKLGGEKPRGYIGTLKQFQGTDLPQYSESDGWTQDKTAEDLGISRGSQKRLACV